MRKVVRPGGAGLTPLGGGLSPAAGGVPAPPRPLAPSAPRPPAAGGHRPAMSAQAYGAYEDAKEITALAEKEADRIRQEAERQRDASVRQGYEEGYRKGYTEALSGLGKLEQQYQDLLSRLEPQVVQLAVGVAEKIIGEELMLRPEAIVDIVGQALKTVRHQRDIVIRVHPEQVEMVEHGKEDLLGILSRAREVRIVADETLRPLGCIIETEVGVLDADVTNQLAELRKALGAR